MTKYGEKIYELVNASHDHMTADQLYSELKKTCPSVVLATVYNNLHKLCQAGLIRRITAEGAPDRFDHIDRHDHLVCKRCGALADVCFDDLTAFLQERLGDAYISYDLKIFYLCPACRKQSENGPARPGTV